DLSRNKVRISSKVGKTANSNGLFTFIVRRSTSSDSPILSTRSRSTRKVGNGMTIMTTITKIPVTTTMSEPLPSLRSGDSFEAMLFQSSNYRPTSTLERTTLQAVDEGQHFCDRLV